MSYRFPEGSKFFFTTSFDTANTVTAATNASPCVLTSAAHGLIDDDVVLFDSSWEDATESLYMVNQLTDDSLELLGLNSSDTNLFPAGSGVGTISKVTGWTELPQVLSISTSGGDARYTTVSQLAKRNDINIPTGFNAMTITVEMGHDPANVNFQSMLDASRAMKLVGFKMVGAGGSGFGYGYMSVNEFPTLNRNEVNKVSAVFSFNGRFMSYSA
ncbi:MAG TPA: hypothetical protein ENO09_07215 [bacterium]|nr:hypothetical protein [bacterium]